MTAGGFREVDEDLLADFVGGALDGTPEQETVARLVAEDSAWAEAYDRLAPAVAAVQADLGRWAEPVEEIPPAVADRITAALAALPAPVGDPADRGTGSGDEPVSDGAIAGPADATEPETGTAGNGTPLVPAQGGPGRRRPGDGVPRSEPGAPTGPGRRRRRWTRIAGPVALAAVSVAAVGLGVNQLLGDRTDGGAAGTAMDQPASAPEAASAADPARTIGPPAHSGLDYTPRTLGEVPTIMKSERGDSPAPAAPGSDAGSQGDRLPAPDGRDRLARLTDQAALATCLREVAAEHRAGPLVVELVDYASFQGEQALVLRFTDETGARWAWVSGPECGVPGSGADTRYRTRVG
ncbi:hypothetical protein [Micromonospora sp. URMC 103]|uniref:hypothetical protein n=1 Tax=Micromonospora sp. URMC 103 TaxID=3423406 RepID=UPI003F1B8B44